jgi:4-amino-4-deoxy-L-arabinose transferase-like glycosyltransferase
MFSERVLKRPAVLCALLLALCTLAAYPFVEMGGNDDFSYVRSAKALAETGHIVFFGWSSAMLGWQLALGAFFIKLFGFSFTVTRASILIVALSLTFLLQRTLVRLGLNETNASFATLTLVLSPLFIPLSFSFMSDIPGLLAIVLCLYLCLRAIKAPSPSQTTAWLIAAAISSALLGTARQTGWLGVLVIVPSTYWLLRRRRLSILVPVVWFLCVLFIFAALNWFSHQMYATAEDVAGIGIDQRHLFNMAVAGLRTLLETAFFLTPIFIAFALAFLKTRNRWVYLSLAGAIVFCAYLALRPDSYWGGIVLAPAASGIGDYVTPRGILELPAIGNRPLVLNFAVRVVITVVSYFAAFAFVILLITRSRRVQAPEAGTSEELSWQQLFLLLGPFTLAYCAFLAFRVFSGTMFDRYLLPMLLVLAVVAVRFYQERISPRLPRTCFAVLFLFAAFGVAGTHDMFAVDRARLAATEQLRAAGLPRTAFYAGFAYDGWTQIDTQGHIDAGGIHTPTGIHHLTEAQSKFNPCSYWAARFYPAIRPKYVISYDNFSCGSPQDTFAPVPYRLWLPPFSGAIYSRSVNPTLLSQSGK